MHLLREPPAAQHAQRGRGLRSERCMERGNAAALLQAKPANAIPRTLPKYTSL